jgi:hypothetical protein
MFWANFLFTQSSEEKPFNTAICLQLSCQKFSTLYCHILRNYRHEDLTFHLNDYCALDGGVIALNRLITKSPSVLSRSFCSLHSKSQPILDLPTCRYTNFNCLTTNTLWQTVVVYIKSNSEEDIKNWAANRIPEQRLTNASNIYYTFMWPCIVTNFFIIKPTRRLEPGGIRQVVDTASFS